MSNPILTDELRGGLSVKLRQANNMRAAGNCGHRRGVAKGTAERNRAKQHGVRRIQSDVAGHIGGVAGNGLLIVQHQLRPARRARRGEGQTMRLPPALVPPCIGCRAIERRHRKSRKLRHA